MLSHLRSTVDSRLPFLRERLRHCETNNHQLSWLWSLRHKLLGKESRSRVGEGEDSQVQTEQLEKEREPRAMSPQRLYHLLVKMNGREYGGESSEVPHTRQQCQGSANPARKRTPKC